ncbi:uncharacterized protein FFB20_13996 [Fusarium fujikuroi]|nr:uncharacterized protein FFB20_13996 [Fusarium fujikuroi]
MATLILADLAGALRVKGELLSIQGSVNLASLAVIMLIGAGEIAVKIIPEGGQQLHGPPPQPCAINLSSSIRLADAPTTPMLLIAAQHTAAQAIPSSSGRSSLVTYALHTRVMVLSMHRHIATQTVATTVATRAQRAIDERFCPRQWDLALRN